MQGDEHTPGAPAIPGIAALYERFLLDPLIEVARCVSFDALKRPRLYRNITAPVAALLDGFRVRTGTAPEWLSAIQRSISYCGIFDGGVTIAALAMRTAAVTYVERVDPQSGHLALQPVRDATMNFRELLTGLQGAAVDQTARQISAVFDSATEILGDEAIARVFGFEPASRKPAGSVNPALIEEIQRSLRLHHLRRALGPHRLVLLEQVGRHGAATIAGVLDLREGGDADAIEALVASAYAWEKSVRALQLTVDVIRAWKEPAYREQLTPEEKDVVRHPSGEIDVKHTLLDRSSRMFEGGAQSGLCSTVGGDACGSGLCSTVGGDPCTLASQGSDYCCGTNTGFTCPVDVFGGGGVAC
jgi:mersacidin/lichenicidin family type 2 lantibiotic